MISEVLAKMPSSLKIGTSPEIASGQREKKFAQPSIKQYSKAPSDNRLVFLFLFCTPHLKTMLPQLLPGYHRASGSSSNCSSNQQHFSYISAHCKMIVSLDHMQSHRVPCEDLNCPVRRQPNHAFYVLRPLCPPTKNIVDLPRFPSLASFR